jgi:N-acetylglucosamine-6-sulfatase
MSDARTRSWLLAALLGLGAVGGAAILILLDGGGSDRPKAHPAPASDWGRRDPPNLIVVMTDDQTLGSFTPEVMPKTLDHFERDGAIFDQAIAAPPLCCPSRAGFLTGRYAHNTGVIENDAGYGSLRAKRQTLPVALAEAGYRTGMFGKFLNGYRRARGARPAPGFTRWVANDGPADYFDFEVSDGGEVKEISGYSTAYFTRKAIGFARDAHAHDQPFFLWLSYNAPHTVAPRYSTRCNGETAQPSRPALLEKFADAPLPRPPSFNERDVSDKPSLVREAGRLGPREIHELRLQWRCSLAAMRDADDQLARLLEYLRGSGELSRTVVVYLSDNGHYFGEHRLRNDKRLPLEPALRVPLAISVGETVGPRTPSRIGELVSQVDLAPSLLDYAGVEPCNGARPCRPMDGRSLRGLLESRAGHWPGNRAIPMRLADGWTYTAMRTPDSLYVEMTKARGRSFVPPEIEMYDLESDPDELHNLAGSTDPALEQRLDDLGTRLSRLHGCSGIEGRDAPRRSAFCE